MIFQSDVLAMRCARCDNRGTDLLVIREEAQMARQRDNVATSRTTSIPARQTRKGRLLPK